MGKLICVEGKPPKAPRVARNGLDILLEIFGMGLHFSRPSELVDVVLIAIDFEKFNTIRNRFAKVQDCQVGLAILDTKKINEVSLDRLISTYNFVVGAPSYHKKVSHRFAFGETIHIRPSEIKDRIQSLIPPARNVVFVGHTTSCELHTLSILGFQFPVLLSAALDTHWIGKEVFEGMSMRLIDLLLRLGFCFDEGDLHCAGNDATFTLKALLRLAVRGFLDQERDLDGDCNMIEVLQELSNYPILRGGDLNGPLLRRWQRTWDQEKNDQIRAAREHKRETVDSFSDAFAIFDQS